MSSLLKSMASIPVDTYQATRNVYNLSHVYLVIGDRLAEILDDPDLTQLDPSSNLDVHTALMLALVTVFQYAESLPDYQAEEATRKRMDWKYALHLSLNHPGFPAHALCQFRQNLFSSSEALDVFHRLVCFLGEAGLFSKADLRTIDPAAVLAQVCQISRVARLRQGLKTELSRLIGQNPEWLRTNAPSHWYIRYGNGKVSGYVRLEPDEMTASAEQLGADIDRLLGLLQRENRLDTGSQSAIFLLNQLLEEQFIRDDDGLHWRFPGCLHCTRARGDDDIN